MKRLSENGRRFLYILYTTFSAYKSNKSSKSFKNSENEENPTFLKKLDFRLYALSTKPKLTPQLTPWVF